MVKLVDKAKSLSLICVQCRAPLEVIDDGWVCAARHTYGLVDGIPTFLTPGITSQHSDDRSQDTKGRQLELEGAEPCDLSVVMPALREGENLTVLVPQIVEQCEALGLSFEILVITDSHDSTLSDIPKNVQSKMSVIYQKKPFYGAALREGFAAAKGEYLLTLDADLSHPPEFLPAMWEARRTHDVVIASRYVSGGTSTGEPLRRVLSSVLNRVFSRGLSLPVRDMSSGFRLMKTAAIRDITLVSRDFDVLEEVLVQAYMRGWTVAEVPFHYATRMAGKSHARIFAFGISYARTFARLWRMRNDFSAADYDARAHNSSIPFQRQWHRLRSRLITRAIGDAYVVASVGGGSHDWLLRLRNGSVAIDDRPDVARYVGRSELAAVVAHRDHLPLADASFPCVVVMGAERGDTGCGTAISEALRVVRPGGRLILVTLDRRARVWRIRRQILSRLLKGAYGRGGDPRWTHEEVVSQAVAHGGRFVRERSILGAEWVMTFRKDAEELGVRG